MEIRPETTAQRGGAAQGQSRSEGLEAGTSEPEGADLSSAGPARADQLGGQRSSVLRPAGSLGVVVFGGAALLLTGIHWRLYGPGHTFETLTGILYTIGAVSLSPVFFFTLVKPLTRQSLQFLGLFASIFLGTAPVFYQPDAVAYGWALGAAGLLVAIFPSWYHYYKFQGEAKGIEEGDPKVLLEALRSPQEGLRKMARIRLIELGTEAIPDLIHAYRSYPANLGKIKREILDLLLRMSRPPQSNEPGLNALGELAAFWMAMARNAKEYELLTLACDGLGRLDYVGAIPVLQDRLAYELKQGGGITRSRDALFDAAFCSLASLIRQPEGGEGVGQQRELLQLLVEFYLKYPGFRRFETLRGMGGPIVATIAGMLPGANARARGELTRILGGVRALAALPMLIGLLNDESSELRALALAALMEYLPQGSRLDAPKGTFPEAAVRPLTDALVRLAGDMEERVRLAALDCLSRLGEASSLPLLLDYLGAPTSPVDDPTSRGRIAANVGRMKDPLALEPLFRLLDAPLPPIVAGAARGLGHLKDPRATTRLKNLLNSQEPEVAAGAAIGLLNQKDETGRAMLLGSLSQPNPPWRRDALEALIRSPDDALLATMEAGLGSPLPGWTNVERELVVSHALAGTFPGGAELIQRVLARDDLDPRVAGWLRLRTAG